MKNQLILLFTLLWLTSSGQRFTLNVESIANCTSALAVDNIRGEDITAADVMPGTEISIIVNDVQNIGKIEFLTKHDDIFLFVEVPKDYIETTGTQIFEILKLGNKMRWKNVIGDMYYPYEMLFTDKDGKECHIQLGQEIPDNKIKTEKIKTEINILSEVDAITSFTNYTYDDCSQMGKANSLLLLDCSPFFSSGSQLFKNDDSGKCKNKKSLNVGEYLKIYLYNFNRYRYNVEINNKFIDVAYGESSFFTNFDNAQEAEENEDAEDKPIQPVAASKTQIEEDKKKEIIQKIVQMAKAKSQLDEFITKVKNSTVPDSKQLDIKKAKINENMIALGLLPIDDNISEKFKSLNEKDQNKYKSDFEKANKLQMSYNEFQLLSYTIQATILPIQIKSYDKFSLSVVLKDAKSGNEINSQDYIYLIRGGIKIDQSFGINLHEIKDKQFSLRPFMANDTVFAQKPNGERLQVNLGNGITKDSIASIKPEVRNEILAADTTNFQTIGLTTLTHFYYRVSGCIGIGPEVGISADIYPKTESRYLLGAGLLFMDGRYRISLDVGYAFGRYKDFSAGQEIGTVLKGQGVTPALIDKFASKLYFGISYNVPINAGNNSIQEAKL